MNNQRTPGLVCQICGHWEQKTLNKHLKEEHNLKTTEYKQQYPEAKTMTGHSKRTVDYWMLQGYSLIEAQIAVKNFQSLAKQRFLEKGIVEGKAQDEMQKQWNQKQANNSKRSLEYWKKRGYSEQEAKNLRAAEQSKHSMRSSKFTGKQHTPESKQRISETMQKRVQEFGAEEWANKFYKGREGLRSTGEINCYMELQKHFPDLKANVTIENYVVDMAYGNTIIEYYGDFWHANPKVFLQDTLPLLGKVQRIHDRDKRRVDKFANLGYNTYIIWEADWKKDKQEEIQKIKKYISYGNTNTDKDAKN